MSLHKYASFALDHRSAQWGDSGTLVKDSHRHTFVYEPRPGYLYVRSRAISSRCNDNYDEFPAEEIKKAYRTFIGKPVFVNHHNENHRRARGVIVDAALHEDINPDGSPDTWAEVLMEVDAVNFPKLAEAVIKGHIDRTSMGTDVEFSVCSACGNKARTPMEYCAHIPRMKGQRYVRRLASGAQEEVLIREICYGLGFFENSLLVEDPADPTAYFLGVDTSGLTMTASKTAAKAWCPECDAELDDSDRWCPSCGHMPLVDGGGWISQNTRDLQRIHQTFAPSLNEPDDEDGFAPEAAHRLAFDQGVAPAGEVGKATIVGDDPPTTWGTACPSCGLTRPNHVFGCPALDSQHHTLSRNHCNWCGAEVVTSGPKSSEPPKGKGTLDKTCPASPTGFHDSTIDVMAHLAWLDGHGPSGDRFGPVNYHASSWLRSPQGYYWAEGSIMMLAGNDGSWKVYDVGSRHVYGEGHEVDANAAMLAAEAVLPGGRKAAAAVPGRVGHRYECVNYGRAGARCEKGNGSAPKRKCRACGGEIAQEDGYFGVFDFTRENHYPVEAAHSLHSNYDQARAIADPEDRVVRWVPVEWTKTAAAAGGPKPETLVAVDWQDQGLSIQPVIDFLDQTPNALMSVERDDSVHSTYYVTYDATKVRGAHVHSVGYQAGFIVSIQKGARRTGMAQFAEPPRIGEKIWVYRNLHTGTLSCQRYTDDGRGLRVDEDYYVPAVRLKNVQFRVRAAGRMKVLEEKKKNVHSFCIGEYAGTAPIPEPYARVRYNPYEAGTYLDLDTGEPVLDADEVYVTVESQYAHPDKGSFLPYIPKGGMATTGARQTQAVSLLRHFDADRSAPPIDDLTPAQARSWVSRTLVDNGRATRKEADRFAHEVVSAPRGTRVEHPSGMAFTVTGAKLAWGEKTRTKTFSPPDKVAEDAWIAKLPKKVQPLVERAQGTVNGAPATILSVQWPAEPFDPTIYVRDPVWDAMVPDSMWNVNTPVKAQFVEVGDLVAMDDGSWGGFSSGYSRGSGVTYDQARKVIEKGPAGAIRLEGMDPDKWIPGGMYVRHFKKRASGSFNGVYLMDSNGEPVRYPGREDANGNWGFEWPLDEARAAVAERRQDPTWRYPAREVVFPNVMVPTWTTAGWAFRFTPEQEARMGLPRSSSKLAYGQTVAPPQVDTMREDTCPVCGEQSSYNGERCLVCQFVKPPSDFMDPDLEKARSVDLRQDQGAGAPEDAGAEQAVVGADLQCDSCGATFSTADAESVPDAAAQPADVERPAGDNAETPAQAQTRENRDNPDKAKQDAAQGLEPVDPHGGQRPADAESEADDGFTLTKSDDDTADVDTDGDGRAESTDDDAATQDAQPQAGDTCPQCGQGTVQPAGDAAQTQPAPPADDGFEVKTDDAKPAEDAQSKPEGDDEDDDDDEKDKKKPPFGKGKESRALSAQARGPRRDSGRRSRVGRLTQEQNDMRPILKALAEQQVVIDAQQRQIDTIANLAGLTPQIEAIKAQAGQRIARLRRQADEANPAQPVPQPAAEAPAATTQEALGDINPAQPEGGSLPNDVTTPGATTETNVAPAATTDVTSIGGPMAAPLDLNEQDVTKPVAGTEGPRPTEEVRIETDVRVNDGVQTETAFPLQGPFGEAPKVGGLDEARPFAAQRLARLRIEAGIAQGDDLALAAAIASDASLSDASLAQEIATLTKVVAVREAQPQRVAEARHLVPRTAEAVGAQRAMPSLAQAAAPMIGQVTGSSIGDDEFAFE